MTIIFVTTYELLISAFADNKFVAFISGDITVRLPTITLPVMLFFAVILSPLVTELFAAINAAVIALVADIFVASIVALLCIFAPVIVPAALTKLLLRMPLD